MESPNANLSQLDTTPIRPTRVPSPAPPDADPPEVKTIPLRRGPRPLAAPPPVQPARTPAPGLPPAAKPAPVPENLAPAVCCPRCPGKLIDPGGLGLCQSCGYCRSLEEDRARVPLAAPQGRPQFPFWFWVLMGAVLAILGVAISLIWVHPGK